jgi:hypothetical protein
MRGVEHKRTANGEIMAKARSELPRGDRSALPSPPLFATLCTEPTLHLILGDERSCSKEKKKDHYEGRGVNTASRHHICCPFSIE